jgi:hypothetical protein
MSPKIAFRDKSLATNPIGRPSSPSRPRRAVVLNLLRPNSRLPLCNQTEHFSRNGRAPTQQRGPLGPLGLLPTQPVQRDFCPLTRAPSADKSPSSLVMNAQQQPPRFRDSAAHGPGQNSRLLSAQTYFTARTQLLPSQPPAPSVANPFSIVEKSATPATADAAHRTARLAGGGFAICCKSFKNLRRAVLAPRVLR